MATVWTAALVAASGCGDNWAAGSADDAAAPDGGTQAYSVVVLPDTQYYASSWPAIFDAQAQWIVDHRAADNIGFVLHTGDIVDLDAPEQWQAAGHSLHLLDGQIPYVLSAGNHDYANLADRMGMINAYFSPSDFEPLPWFGGTFESGHLENSFYLLSTPPLSPQPRWLVLTLEFGPRDEVLAWASTVLASHADALAIVITHAYLFRDGTRYDRNRTDQQYNPHDYVMSGQPGTSINDGEEMWQKLILPNRNVKLVLSGHDVNHAGLPPGTAARLTSARPDGSLVHQLLANYQTCVAAPCELDGNGATVRGGNGYLRLLRFSADGRTVTVTTYSPFLDAFLDDAGNRFTLNMN